MATLLFCTAYAPVLSVWETRYRLWLAAARTLGADRILLVDDGSPVLPGWPDLHVMSVDVVGDAFATTLPGAVTLVHFRSHLGRRGTLDFPGWHRSFAFAALLGAAQGFDRVIHLESDLFLLSDRARAFVRDFPDGWAAAWAPQFDMPESAIQVAAGSGVRTLAAFARAPYAALIGRQHETAMGFTHVERGLLGRRFDETAGDIPDGLDYAAQVPSRREAGFYWFLPDRRRVVPARLVRLTFCAGGDGLAALGTGWADPEPRHHWMLGGESLISLPPLPGTGAAVLRLGVTPHVHGDALTRQRLALEMNGTRLREFDIFLECVLGCDVPAARVRAEAANILRLIHPDAAAPCDLVPAASDTRRLSVSVEGVEWGR